MNLTKIVSACFWTILFVTLIATNPKEYQLKEFISQNLKGEAVEEGGFSGALKEVFAEPQSWLMTLETKRTNLFVFSYYKVSGIANEKKYIGIFNTFIELPT